MPHVRDNQVAYSLRFDDPPNDALVHSVYQTPNRVRLGLTSCNMSFTYTGHMDAPLRYYASSVGELM